MRSFSSGACSEGPTGGEARVTRCASAAGARAAPQCGAARGRCQGGRGGGARHWQRCTAQAPNPYPYLKQEVGVGNAP